MADCEKESSFSFVSQGGREVNIKLGDSEMIKGWRSAIVVVDSKLYPVGEGPTDEVAVLSSVPIAIFPQAREILRQRERE